MKSPQAAPMVATGPLGAWPRRPRIAVSRLAAQGPDRPLAAGILWSLSCLSWGSLGILWGSLRVTRGSPLGSSWGSLGRLLGPVLDVAWDCCGSHLGPLGFPWDGLGVAWGRLQLLRSCWGASISGELLGRPGAWWAFERGVAPWVSWASLGGHSGSLRRFRGGSLGGLWGSLGVAWGHLGTVLGGHRKVSGALSQGTWGPLWARPRAA